jgi:plastocyanin
MRRGAFLFAMIAAATARAAPSGERGAVDGRVLVTRAGAPVTDATVVVYVVGFDEPPPSAVAEIHQKGKRFVPELVPITAGQSVSFPNDDPFFHNVFSPSPAHSFDLGQYPKGDAKLKRFGKIGVIDVFCNIHPQMAATILVLPNHHFARLGADGRFRIDDLPPGNFTLYAYSRRATEPVRAALSIAAGATATVELTIEETLDEAPPHANKFGEKYRDPEKYRQ